MAIGSGLGQLGQVIGLLQQSVHYKSEQTACPVAREPWGHVGMTVGHVWVKVWPRSDQFVWVRMGSDTLIMLAGVQHVHMLYCLVQ